MSKRRDRDAERYAIGQAAQRLLTGAPIRSATGELTITELIAESQIRRDVLYGDHRDLIEDFKTKAFAQGRTPTLMTDLAEQNSQLKKTLAEFKAQLTREQAISTALRQLAAEQAIELALAQEPSLRPDNVVALTPRPRR